MHHRQWEDNMSLRLLSRCACFLLAVALFVQCATGAEPKRPQKTLVEVWSGGDDGLTQRLRAAIEKKFESSADFEKSEGKKPGTLVVTIPTNVSWRQKGERTEVLYTIEFGSSDGRSLGVSKGHCWDDDLDKCSTRIVRDARAAARKVR